MTKKYSYNYEIYINFDHLIEKYKLKKKHTFNVCKSFVYEYIITHYDYNVVNNYKEIARDLYSYLQAKDD